MSRIADSPLVKRGFTKQSTYRFGSICSKIMDDSKDSIIESIDIEDAWRRLNKQEQKTQNDMNKMIEQFGQLKYFKNIKEEGSIECLKIALKQALPIQTFPDEILFRQGTQADNMYILLEGNVNIFHIPYIEDLQQAEHESQENLKNKNMLIRTVRVGESIGNLNLYYGKSYKNMAICAESCKFISLNKHMYKKSLMMADKISAEQELDFLRSVDIFCNWTNDKLIDILLLSSLEKLNCYSVLYNQNQKSSDFYIIKSGQYGAYQRKAIEQKTGIKSSSQLSQNNEQNKYEGLEQHQQDDISKQHNLTYIQEYGPLDHIGHLDIMNNKRRNYFVVCKSKEGGEVIRFKSSIFIQLILSNTSSAKLLLQEKIDDQIFSNPQKRLQNFQSCLQKTDIDNYTKQLRKQQVFQSIDISSISQNNVPNKSYFPDSSKKIKTTSDINNISNKSSIFSTDVPLDSSQSYSQYSGSGTSSQMKIKSQNIILPQIKLPKRFMTTTSLTQIHNKDKQTLQHSPLISNLSLNNQCPSLNHIECQTPLSSKKSPLLKRIRFEEKSGQLHSNIFLNDNNLSKSKNLITSYYAI